MKSDKKTTKATAVAKSETKAVKPAALVALAQAHDAQPAAKAAAVKSTPAVSPVATVKSLAKQRVQITAEAKPRANAPKKISKPAAPATNPAAAEAKPVDAAIQKTVKPAARSQVIPRVKTTKAKVKTPVIPAILLEGDAPSTPLPSGPGQRYALSATPVPEHANASEELGELPEAYGTQRLLLTARDPHWVYAHWDFTREQLKKFNQLSADGHLVLRLFENAIAGEPLDQTHVHPESRHWFLHVPRGGAKYIGELGYYDQKSQWVSVAISKSTLTPPDSLSEDTTVRFANLPMAVPFKQLLALVKTAVHESVPLAEAVLQLRAEGHENLPDATALGVTRKSSTRKATAKAPSRAARPAPAPTPEWTPAQEQALAEIITMDSVRRVWMGSLEITELVKRQLLRKITTDLANQAGEQLGLTGSPFSAISSVTSAFGGEMPQRGKGFWFNVNAELIIYGATEPDAQVTIGGRVISLRSDGSFSYRFALPDGQYELPCIATSADKTDSRAAELSFQRATNYRGEVGTHPQDATLKTPKAENIS